MVHPENAEIHILEDEAASRAFIDMMWAEVMFIYQNFPVKLTLSKDMDKELKELQKQFMPEDTKAGLIQSFLDNFKGTQVCSKLIYAEALNHPFDEPKQWEIREINEIMNNSIEGWRPFSNPRSFAKYGRQRGWERIPPPDNEPSATGSNLTDGFRELTEEEARQMELPFWKNDRVADYVATPLSSPLQGKSLKSPLFTRDFLLWQQKQRRNQRKK